MEDVVPFEYAESSRVDFAGVNLGRSELTRCLALPILLIGLVLDCFGHVWIERGIEICQ